MPYWVEYLLRILMAVGLGFAIGIERQLRYKLGGIRTHAVVALGACIFMIISKYAFFDTEKYDSARIAAQVVSGISFIGAGMIMYRQESVHGLTSAAAIWVTSAIGMTVGAGMYYVAFGATVIVILTQVFFHLPIKIFNGKHYNEISITFKSPSDGTHLEIKTLFNIKSFTSFKASRVDGEIVYCAVIHTKKQIDAEFIQSAITTYPFILTIEKNESDR